MRRTTATTEYLKECMGTALLKLMEEKPMEKISIEEMTAKADVGRSTYFRYFRSKEEVITFKLLCLWKKFCEEKNAAVLESGTPEETRLFFEFCLALRSINDLLYQTGHQNTILYAYMQIIAPTQEQGDAKTYYLNHFLAYGLFGLVDAWICRGYQETPDEMAEIVRSWTAASESRPFVPASGAEACGLPCAGRLCHRFFSTSCQFPLRGSSASSPRKTAPASRSPRS